jgi:hypothetical protein
MPFLIAHLTKAPASTATDGLNQVIAIAIYEKVKIMSKRGSYN